MENNVILKPFEIDGVESWTKVSRRTLCVLRVFPDEMSFEVAVLKGCNPNVHDLINFVLSDKDVRLLIRKYQQSKRVLPFAINGTAGMSGRVDVFIDFYDEYGMQVSSKHLLHVSCYGKVDRIKKMYVGDFVEMVHAGNFPRFKSSGKYIKPYLAPDWVGTDVHKII